jgi:hypothetical protein
MEQNFSEWNPRAARGALGRPRGFVDDALRLFECPNAAMVFDGFFEMHLSPWDVAAGSLLVTEAGGMVSDFSGSDRWLERGNIVGAPPGMHDDLIRMINRHVTEEELDRSGIGRILTNDR